MAPFKCPGIALAFQFSIPQKIDASRIELGSLFVCLNGVYILSILAGFLALYWGYKALKIFWFWSKYRDWLAAWRIAWRQVWVGMSSSQLIDALGRPVEVDQSVTSKRVKEVWKYHHKGANRYGIRINLDDDIVCGWGVKDTKSLRMNRFGCSLGLAFILLVLYIFGKERAKDLPSTNSAATATPNIPPVKPTSIPDGNTANASAPTVPGIARTWTHSKTGHQVMATLVKWNGSTVTLSAGDTVKDLPLNDLVPEDQAYVRSQHQLFSR